MARHVSVSGDDATDGNICVHLRSSAVDISFLPATKPSRPVWRSAKKNQPRMNADARRYDSDEETSRVEAQAESKTIWFSRYGPLTAARQTVSGPIHV